MHLLLLAKRSVLLKIRHFSPQQKKNVERRHRYVVKSIFETNAPAAAEIRILDQDWWTINLMSMQRPTRYEEEICRLRDYSRFIFLNLHFTFKLVEEVDN